MPQRTRRPAWSLLYAIVPLVGAVLAAAEFFFSEGLARTAAELFTVGAGIALAHLWLGCNRVALAQQVTAESQGKVRSLSPRSVQEEANR